MKILDEMPKKIRVAIWCESCGKETISLIIVRLELFKGFVVNLWLCKDCLKNLKRYIKLERRIREA